MKAAKVTTRTDPAALRLEAFIGKFDPKDQRLIRAVRRAVRKRLPTANELVWDNYNFFVIGYSPIERPSDSIVSIAARANGVACASSTGRVFPIPGGCSSAPGVRRASFGLNQPRFWRAQESRPSSPPRLPRRRRPCPRQGAAGSSSDRFQQSSGRAEGRRGRRRAGSAESESA